MLMKTLAASVLAVALAVAGCSTTSSTGGASTTSTTTVDTAQIIQDAQAAALALCAVAPTAASITSIIVAQDAGATASTQTAELAAQLFCSAVTKLSAPRRLRTIGGAVLDFGTITVNGVQVDVQGVRK